MKVSQKDGWIVLQLRFDLAFRALRRSNQMAQHLSTKLGFKKVYNVEGGIHAYATRVDSSVGVY